MTAVIFSWFTTRGIIRPQCQMFVFFKPSCQWPLGIERVLRTSLMFVFMTYRKQMSFNIKKTETDSGCVRWFFSSSSVASRFHRVQRLLITHSLEPTWIITPAVKPTSWLLDYRPTANYRCVSSFLEKPWSRNKWARTWKSQTRGGREEKSKSVERRNTNALGFFPLREQTTSRLGL